MSEITRNFVNTLRSRIGETKPLIQVVLGPRQVGKTTGVKQLLSGLETPSVYASADKTISTPSSWILEKWQEAKHLGDNTTLVIDEIQKINNWPETVKSLWDTNSNHGGTRLVLLGSSSLRLQQGLTESMTGRFEVINVPHWSYLEFVRAFNCSFEDYLIYGGYPGAFRFHSDSARWLSYMRNSIFETVIGQDILSIRSVAKPSLFRQAFEILSSYPAQEISYTKLLGQLQDKGNTDLIRSYISIYEAAYLFKSLSKYSNEALKKKSSSPKILPMCPAIFTAQRGSTEDLDSETRGRLFELVVGSDLVQSDLEVSYWRQANNEVDFVVNIGPRLYAIEVKSGRKKNLNGLAAFAKEFSIAKPVVITPDNYVDFATDPRAFLTNV